MMDYSLITHIMFKHKRLGKSIEIHRRHWVNQMHIPASTFFTPPTSLSIEPLKTLEMKLVQIYSMVRPDLLLTLTVFLQAVSAQLRRASTSSRLGSPSETVLGGSACDLLGLDCDGGDKAVLDAKGGGGVRPQPGGGAGLVGGV